mmetsp:Transcript_50746/g.100262  ORF Transcript_50746/g.100262 Transcript_50746/m.100262 type:complete len:178 (-) Transcript_50746:585-1118(-)
MPAMHGKHAPMQLLVEAGKLQPQKPKRRKRAQGEGHVLGAKAAREHPRSEQEVQATLRPLVFQGHLHALLLLLILLPYHANEDVQDKYRKEDDGAICEQNLQQAFLLRPGGQLRGDQGRKASVDDLVNIVIRPDVVEGVHEGAEGNKRHDQHRHQALSRPLNRQKGSGDLLRRSEYI